MILSARNKAELVASIDTTYNTRDRLVARYRNAFSLGGGADEANDRLFKQRIEEYSIEEGSRILPLTTYKGVELHLLDETSWMSTASLKSIDGCLAAALCSLDSVRRIVFESGGNTGSALSHYGRKAGMETFFFCPSENLDLLDSAVFSHPSTHLLGVRNRHQVKEFAGVFARTTGIRHVPEKSWRYVAAMFRGLFILEHMLKHGSFDLISQTVSAGFGPIGIFNVLRQFGAELGQVPRFIGIQQEANCPLFRSWKSIRTPVTPQTLLTRIMYDQSPQTYKTFDELRELLILTRGDLLTLNQEEFDAILASTGILGLLKERGIDITVRDGQVVEKTGMIALLGTFKAIDLGLVPAGSRLLCALTSGVSRADGRAVAHRTFNESREVEAWIDELGLRAFPAPLPEGNAP